MIQEASFVTSLVVSSSEFQSYNLCPWQSIVLRSKQVLLVVSVASSTTSQKAEWKVLVNLETGGDATDPVLQDTRGCSYGRDTA